MQRRGFLQALAGVAAGLAGANAVASQLHLRGSAPPATTPSEPLPGIPSSPPPQISDGFSSSVNEARATLIEMLKDCRVIEHSTTTTVFGSQTVTVTYRHSPEAARTELDAEVDQLVVGKMHPRSVTISQTGVDIDIDPFSSDSLMYGYVSVYKGSCELEVEWVG